MSDTTPGTPKLSWWRRLSSGLKRTSSSLGTAVADLVTKRKLDRAMLDDIEDVLLRADLGTAVAVRIADAVGAGRYDKAISADEVKTVVATEVEKVLAPVAKPLEIDQTQKPFVILVVGVNGSGKTTTIGKLAAKLSAEGRKVMLAAGDTFRAAAIEQLKVWGERTRSPVIAGAQGSDSASLAFNALTAAKEQNIDVLLVDTAGRLQNKAELMNELEKVVRVIKKVDASAPHAVLLVLDATVGQNALSQVEAFHRTAGVTGLVMTKLDGTARGGILVALAEKFKLPVHFIGVGEGIDDLAPFTARDFANAIAGLSNHPSRRERWEHGLIRISAMLSEGGAKRRLEGWRQKQVDELMDKTQPHPLFKLATELGPLLVFFVANAKFNLFVATGAFMVAIVAAMIASYMVVRHVPMMAIVTGVIVIVFGTLTLVLHDETFIKVKPTIIYGLFAAILGGGLLFGRSFIAIMFDQMFNLTPKGWRILTMRWALFFLGMAILNEIIWRTQSTDFWVGFKAFGVIPITMVFAIAQMPLTKRYHLEPATLEASEADAGDVSKG